MISRSAGIGVFLASVVLAAPAGAAPGGGGDERHCPSATATNSNMFFAAKSGTGTDRDRLDALGGVLAQRPQPVCILALLDPDDAVHSKKLALRRVVWVRQALLARGVPVGVIAEEFRLGGPGQSKDDFRQVNVIVGR